MMTPFRFVAPALAAVALLTTADIAHAGWDNVFQVACWDCRPRARTSYSPPVQHSSAKTEIVERCGVETITVMKPTVVREEVSVQVKSYYWDPVTTYTQRSYYNSATGCSEDISVPRTSYVRKESCNTVMKYVERMKMVPTEVQRKVCEKTPVTTIIGPTTKSYSYDCDNCGLPPTSSSAPPRVEVMPSSPPSVMQDQRIPPQSMPTISNSMQRPAKSTTTQPYTGKVNARTTSSSAIVRGEVVQSDRATPNAGAKLVFVSKSDYAVREFVTADEFGTFDVKLPAGEWLVYLGNGNGRAERNSTVTVGSYDAKNLTVVSR